MASNATTYKNLTPAQPLDKKTLNKMVWRILEKFYIVRFFQL